MFTYQITRPFSYLRIEHPVKKIFDWLAPLAISIISSLIFILCGNEINFLGENGFISKISSFVQILPGFYIAALAAIATFNRHDIDKYMPDPTPQVDIIIRGQKNKIKLTRRRFLCMLFAFLTAESILLAILSVFSTSFSSSIKAILPQNTHSFSLHAFLFMYVFLFWQMIIATFLGLYYLGDRLNQPDSDAL